MKVCKKCKTHVANKAKICKNCGADVSNAKIIKNAAPSTGKTKKVKIVKKEDNSNNVSVKSIKQDKPIETSIKEELKKNKITIPKVKKLKYIKNSKTNYKEVFVKTKTTLLKVLKTIYEAIKKGVIVIGINIAIISKKVFYFIKTGILMTGKGLEKLFKFIVKTCKVVKIKTIVIVKSISVFIKEKYNHFKEFLFDKKIKRQEIRLEKAKLKEEKRKQEEIRKQEEEKIKQEEEKLLEEKRQQQLFEEKEELEKEEPVKKTNKRKKGLIKVGVICLIIGSVVAAIWHYSKIFYEDLTGKPMSIVSSKKATTDKIFSMDDVINYNGVDYKIVKVETSQGNAYKAPKDGNQFLIVTVYIKNTSNKKVSYSYQNWTMSNSKKEENKRIFTSINVDTALYSGELVVGGVKSGSMVFEQPIDDPKLVMNFYKLKKDEEGYNVTDLSKRVFSISVKVPNNKSSDTDSKKSSDNKDTTINNKTDDKSKS